MRRTATALQACIIPPPPAPSTPAAACHTCIGHTTPNLPLQLEMSAAGYHDFYAKQLCGQGNTSSSSSGCSGIALDIGAFIGTHALVLSRLGFEVHAFEPQVGVLRRRSIDPGPAHTGAGRSICPSF